MKYYILNKKNEILLSSTEEGKFLIPTLCPVAMPAPDSVFDMAEKVGEEAVAFLSDEESPSGLKDGNVSFRYVPIRESWDLLTPEDYLAASRASEWVFWERSNRFCPVCGSPLERHMDMGKRCPNCGTEHFPHIAPCIIVRIRRRVGDRDEILLVRAKTFRRVMFGLVAGFVEGGETFEQAVAREVREETGLEVDNIRYFASQPWPFPSQVMVGFTADWISGEVDFRDGELIEYRWASRETMPENIPDPMSIARRLIEDWRQRKCSIRDSSSFLISNRVLK